MLSIVFNLQYLSQNFIKFKDQGQFWNPHDEQIPKLSLGVQFDQEIMEKTWETSCLKLTDHYCIFSDRRHISEKSGNLFFDFRGGQIKLLQLFFIPTPILYFNIIAHYCWGNL